MKIHFILIAAIALLPLACKKEIREIETPPAVDVDLCTGNSWKFDNFFKAYEASVPGLGNFHSMPIVYDNKVYVFNPNLDIIRIYDGVGWTSISSQIPFVDPVNIGFTLGNKGYLMPVWGVNFWQYNFTNNTWAMKADFPGPDRQNATVFTIGNKGYIAGGASFDGYYNDTWEYNQASNTWTEKAHFSFIAMGYATGFSIGNKGYMVNGYFNWPNGLAQIYSNNLLEFDPATNAWTAKADFPGGARYHTAAFVIAGAAYVGGGNRGWTDPYNDFYKYTPGTDSWSRIADAPVSSLPFFSFSINSKGYVVYYEDQNQNPPDEHFMYKYTPRMCTQFGSSLPVANTSPID